MAKWTKGQSGNPGMTVYPYLPKATVATTTPRAYLDLLAAEGVDHVLVHRARPLLH